MVVRVLVVFLRFGARDGSASRGRLGTTGTTALILSLGGVGRAAIFHALIDQKDIAPSDFTSSLALCHHDCADAPLTFSV